MKSLMKLSSFSLILLIFLLTHSTLADSCKRYQNGKCVECIDRYTMYNGYCRQCSSHCQKCQAAEWAIGGTQCLSCDLGYYITKYNDCGSCGKNCLTCTERYLNSPNCTLCDSQSEPYEYNGGIRCKQIVRIWPILLGFGIGLTIFFTLVIRWILKTSRKNARDGLFKLQIIEEPLKYTLKNETINYILSYKTPNENPRVDHEITIQIYQQLTASVKYTQVSQQRYGNSVYRTYSTGYRSLDKIRKIAQQKLIVKGEQLENGYRGQMNYIGKIGYGISAQHSLEARGLMKVKIRRMDWQVNQIAQVERSFKTHFNNRIYKFSSESLHVDLQNASAQIRIRKAQLTQDWVSQQNRYYGLATVFLQGKTANQMKITYKLEKTYKANFGFFAPSKFKKISIKNIQYVKGGHSTQMLQKKEVLIPNNPAVREKQLTFSISQCQIDNEAGFLTSTPLTLVFWIRPTGFLSWLLSIFITKKYQVPIMIEPSQ